MKKSVLFFAVAAGLAVSFGWARQGEIRELRQQNQQLLEQARELSQLTEEIGSFEPIEIDPNELERLRPARRELARLRSELTLLREAARTGPDELQQQIESASSEAAREQREFELLQAREESRLITRDAMNELGSLIGMAREVARLSGGPFPVSFPQFEEALRFLAEETDPMQWRFRTRWKGWFDEEHHRFGRVPVFFEFVPRSQPLFPGGHAVPLLRERTPRALPDGGWARVYGFSDGRAEEVALPDGAYAEWERQMAAR
jgi:hypothetical protein